MGFISGQCSKSIKRMVLWGIGMVTIWGLTTLRVRMARIFIQFHQLMNWIMPLLNMIRIMIELELQGQKELSVM